MTKAPRPLTKAQWTILDRLDRGDALNGWEWKTTRYFWDKAPARCSTATIDGLERRGWVKVVWDGLVCQVKLTAKGRIEVITEDPARGLVDPNFSLSEADFIKAREYLCRVQ